MAQQHLLGPATVWDGLGVDILVRTLLEELGREAASEVDRPGLGNPEVVRFGLEVERCRNEVGNAHPIGRLSGLTGVPVLHVSHHLGRGCYMEVDPLFLPQPVFCPSSLCRVKDR